MLYQNLVGAPVKGRGGLEKDGSIRAVWVTQNGCLMFLVEDTGGRLSYREPQDMQIAGVS